MAGESGGFRQLERVNRRRTWTLVVKLILVLAGIGLGLDFLFHTVRFSDGRLSGLPLFTAAAVILVVAQMLRANYAGADLVLGALHAHPFFSDDPKNQVITNVVREMALAARIPVPRIDVIDDPSPNAFAIGRDAEHSVICVTQGLLDQMDREELQGVIGHEMAHIRNCDTRLTTLVTAMFGGFGAFSGRLISIMLSREREYLADASAVEFTRNPTALIRALEHIAKTESPLRYATTATAPLFIVDPLQSASGGRSYQEFINEVTRIRLQPDKTQEQRDTEARTFAAHEFPRNMILQAVSSHPPLPDRIARLQALLSGLPGAEHGALAPSAITDDQLKAKFRESATFVRNVASTDPEVLAKVMQSALLGSEGGRNLLQNQIGVIQSLLGSAPRDPLEEQLSESNLASTGDSQRHPIASSGPMQGLFLDSIMRSTGGEGLAKIFAPGAASIEGGDSLMSPVSADQEELQRETLAKMLAPVAASMRPKYTAPRPPAADRPGGSMAAYLFWFVILLSAAAIAASFAIR